MLPEELLDRVGSTDELYELLAWYQIRDAK